MTSPDTPAPAEHPSVRLGRLGEAFRRAARISGISLNGINAETLAAELDGAGLLLTPEREAALRREGREDAMIAVIADNHVGYGLADRKHFATVALGRAEPRRVITILNASATSEETPTHG